MDYSWRYYQYQTKARGLLSKKDLEHSFLKMADLYRARVGKFLPMDKDALCLDLPCGYGNFLFFLRLEGYRNIFGCDQDVRQIQLAQLLNLPVKNADVFEVLSENIESVDLLSSIDFIEHLSKDSALEFLDQCYLSLKKSGVLIIRTPCADGPFGAHDANNDLTHQWSMTSNVLRTILEMVGFSNVIILEERPLPGGFINTCRWLVYFPAKAVANLFCVTLGMRPPRIWSRSMIAVAYK